ncbi:unnamed protein product [Meloidogyne enterolobii]|uniref:Uncharacterized protein n=1 Tax=Meloidogyne enterolobii TaxID=390850 RepID=A0ACB1AVU0_MELEN
MPYYNLLFIFLLPQLLILIAEVLSTENIDSNNDCSCPNEEIFDSDWRNGVFKSPGFSVENCDNLDCKWNILPEENTFIYAMIEGGDDILNVYQTSWNGSTLLKFQRSSLSSGRFYNPSYNLHLSSSINGGLYFHFVANGINHNHTGFEVTFSRRSDDGLSLNFPCPQPFYFATNSPQRLPAFRLRILDGCIFTINSTQAIKLKIEKINKTSKFNIWVCNN